jgi:phosphate uptake regulator
MLHELLKFFRSAKPLEEMGNNFSKMFELAYHLTCEAGEIYFGKKVTPEERTRIYKRDVEINKLERVIRKQVIAHLSLAGNSPNLPYSLLLMSLVKDVERIGDYAKNLTEIHDFHPDPLPEDEIVAELREISTGVESAFAAAKEAFATSDRERAVELIQEGRDMAQRADALIIRVARSDYNAATTTAVVLGVRYYKRIGGHVLNVLSSVVMPLHKLDYYDEDEGTVAAGG